MMRPTIRTEADRDSTFAGWIKSLPGAEGVSQCIHCGLCAGSCPLSRYMDRSPRQLLYLAREGFREDVLRSFTIWLCTSCYTCTVRCPRGIQVTELMYALKRRAIEEGLYPKRFAIPVLAREFGRMVRSRGRITESRLVLRLMLKTNLLRLFRMIPMGGGLLRTGRFSLRPETIRDRDQLSKLLDHVGNGKEMAA
jgi:quinone-modifying oxidoreductase subunit QmoC